MLYAKMRRALEALFYVSQARTFHRLHRAPGANFDERAPTLDIEMAALDWFESHPKRTLCLAAHSSFLKSSLEHAVTTPTILDTTTKWTAADAQQLVDELKAHGIAPGPDGNFTTLVNPKSKALLDGAKYKFTRGKKVRT